MNQEIIFHDVIQNSDEWFELRKGKFTASKAKDLFSAKSTAAYNNLIYKVVFEILTGEIPESFKNEWMLRGNELESEAIDFYKKENFIKINNGGFFEFNDFVGASPDGLIGKEGLLQVKCPSHQIHIDYLYSGKIPKEYILQVQFEMMCSDRLWCDLFFYHPKLKKITTRIKRDEIIICEIKHELEIAIEKAKKIIDKIK